MSSTDDKEQKFPEGFEHARDRLNDTAERLQQIDDQIRNIPKEKGPTLEYKHPHFVGRVIPGSRDKTRVALQEKQHEIKMDTLSRTDAETRGASGQTGRVVRDRVRESLFPNPYRTLSQEDRLDQRSVPKEIEQSQDYMDAMLSPKEYTPKEVVQPKQEMHDKTEKKSLSMSARFSMSLGFTRLENGPTQPTGEARRREKDKDREN